MYITQALFSFKGRLNRQGFWIGSGLCAVVLFIIANILPVQQWLQHTTTSLGAIIPLLLIVYCWLTIIIKRLHDRGRSAKAIIILFVPLCCVMIAPYSQGIMQSILGKFFPIFIVAMLLMEWGVFLGQPTANRYGEKGETITFKKG
ncbi:membrane protein [Gallibacterium genomosp. 3]|uniref:Membrane protein n=1 Tax=Gallibacterium genomosp. 3 TaxID=505345 RepID=A0A1A7PHA2_9PAST|nr:DUF805 domain-containing protein [Gallibacterium genomosp. 3]OBX01868.1 membrane protein [Gallibacterium genomosp. 3]